MRRPGETFSQMKPSQIPRKFKSLSEVKSLEIRDKLGLKSIVACPARSVADLYGTIVTPLQCLPGIVKDGLQDHFPDSDKIDNCIALLSSRDCGFSAVAAVVGPYKIILYNANNSPARQESDIMHEMAHIICEHQGDCLQLNADIGLRKYDTQCEEEAKWLGAALQIPEKGLLELAKAGYTNEEIAITYGASVQMAIYRRRVLAIDRRLSYIRAKK